MATPPLPRQSVDKRAARRKRDSEAVNTLADELRAIRIESDRAFEKALDRIHIIQLKQRGRLPR